MKISLLEPLGIPEERVEELAEKEKTSTYLLGQAKYHALQAQINPHFLFNTLHFINWNVISLTKGPNAASEMLENLSTILNYSLREPMQAVMLSEEIHCTLCYINIIHARFPDRFMIHWEFDEPLPELKTPKLLLQPLIENCIVHGIQNERTLLHISVQITETGQGLRIIIADDGQGIEDSRIKEAIG